jgi:hypothetical protein
LADLSLADLSLADLGLASWRKNRRDRLAGTRN